MPKQRRGGARSTRTTERANRHRRPFPHLRKRYVAGDSSPTCRDNGTLRRKDPSRRVPDRHRNGWQPFGAKMWLRRQRSGRLQRRDLAQERLGVDDIEHFARVEHKTLSRLALVQRQLFSLHAEEFQRHAARRRHLTIVVEVAGHVPSARSRDRCAAGQKAALNPLEVWQSATRS